MTPPHETVLVPLLGKGGELERSENRLVGGPAGLRSAGTGNGRVRPDPGAGLNRRHRLPSYDGRPDRNRVLEHRRRPERITAPFVGPAPGTPGPAPFLLWEQGVSLARHSRRAPCPIEFDRSEVRSCSAS